MKYEQQSERALTEFENFLNTPLEVLLRQHLDKNPAGEMIKLFHDVAANVPAYKAFLAQQQINPDTIQNAEDFQKLPPLTKDNYLKCYGLADLCRYGKIENCDMIAASSGSTGNLHFGCASLRMNYQSPLDLNKYFTIVFLAIANVLWL